MRVAVVGAPPLWVCGVSHGVVRLARSERQATYRCCRHGYAACIRACSIS